MDEQTRLRIQALIDNARAALLDRMAPLAGVVGTCLSIARSLAMAPEERWLLSELNGYEGKKTMADSLMLPPDHALVGRAFRYRAATAKFFIADRDGRLIELPYESVHGPAISEVERQARAILQLGPLQRWQATKDVPVRELHPDAVALLQQVGVNPEQQVRLHYKQDLALQVTEGLRAALAEFLADAELIVFKQSQVSAAPTSERAASGSISIGSAQQVLIGNHGVQVRIEPPHTAVAAVFRGLRQMVEARSDLAGADRRELVQQIDELETYVSGAQADPIRAGQYAREVGRRAPWLLSKLGELTIGAAASALGGAIVEGIRLGLTYLSH